VRKWGMVICAHREDVGNFRQQLYRQSRGLSGGGADEDINEDIKRILSFWFGQNYLNLDGKELESADYMKERSQIWWEGSAKVDEEAKTFTSLIEEVGGGRENQARGWNSPKGYLARIVLLDQLSRNAHRATPLAFKFDKRATELTVEAHEKGYIKDYAFPELQFAVMPLMHSESLEHHKLLESILRTRLGSAGEDVKGNLEFMISFALSHKEVIEKFGRYPHRNKLLNRETTPEEAEWLKSDDVPTWAKSQG